MNGFGSEYQFLNESFSLPISSPRHLHLRTEDRIQSVFICAICGRIPNLHPQELALRRLPWHHIRGGIIMELEPTPQAKQDFKAQDRSLPFKGPEAIDVDVLECFAYEYAGKHVGDPMEITTTTEEFTSVCPFSGLPDFARVTITYTPAQHCIELRSLKYYLMSYRDVGIWYEHLVNRMLGDLVNACKPKQMTVVVECAARGGLRSTVTAQYARD